jgi:phytoene/squalene synthetase
MKLFHQVSEACSKITTRQYSTSFASAIKLLHKDLHKPIYSIYGFVRFADEIVDTFHDYDKALLLDEFRQQTHLAVQRRISLNPILHSFQQAVHTYNINPDLIDEFFNSMMLDLDKKKYNDALYNQYIYGSAEVVGLMCLSVFCEGNDAMFNNLKSYAQSLGAAFQKVNFLRDMQADYIHLNRVYFPGCDFNNFNCSDKARIEADIQKDFAHAFKGILQLPIKSKFGVYVAYKYYLSLFHKIQRTQPQKILQQRIRIPDYSKMFIVAKASIHSRLNLL